MASQGMPAELLNKLKQYQARKADIKSIAFTPDGKGWTIVSDGSSIAEDVDGGYAAALQNLKAKNLKIQSVAFNPTSWASQHGFVIIHDKGYVAEGVPSHLKKQLDQFSNQTQGIKAVEFTPDGGWTVIAMDQEWSRMIQGDQVKFNFIDRVRAAYLDGQLVKTASFNPQEYSILFGWILITDKGYEGMNVPEKLKQDLLKFSIKKLN